VLAIYHNPGISQEQLARHICINKSNVTRALATLEEQGYVERHHSETDKRVTLVYPTKKMIDIYPTVKEISTEWNDYLSADLTEEERALFQKTLEKISARAQTYIDNGSIQII
jgi:DNA-binding MarR family transcriptional regulator